MGKKTGNFRKRTEIKFEKILNYNLNTNIAENKRSSRIRKIKFEN